MTTERFLTLADVAEILNISASQTYALVRSGDLQGIQIGGRNQWRVERSKLEEYIEQAYRRTASNLSELPSTLPPTSEPLEPVRGPELARRALAGQPGRLLTPAASP